jgi:hypothetical protein
MSGSGFTPAAREIAIVGALMGGARTPVLGRRLNVRDRPMQAASLLPDDQWRCAPQPVAQAERQGPAELAPAVDGGW